MLGFEDLWVLQRPISTDKEELETTNDGQGREVGRRPRQEDWRRHCCSVIARSMRFCVGWCCVLLLSHVQVHEKKHSEVGR